MASNVTVIQLGAQPQVKEADTVAELIETLGLDNPSVKVNGETITDLNYELNDYDHVSFGAKVKGGNL